ncbi:MAG: abortive infection family protein [Methanosarcinaceae archaeon]
MIHKDLFGQEEEIERKQFFSYENIPAETRQKVFFVIDENGYHLEKDWSESERVKTEDFSKLRYEICKHKGIPEISDKFLDDDAIYEWIMNCPVEDFLRTIELFIRVRLKDRTKGYRERLINTIRDINDIFNIDKVGYEIEIVSGKIIRRDSEFLHEQVVKKAITLLYVNDFKGPLEEFEKALDHYLKKEYKDTIQEANNSFESTMKAVLTKLNLDFNQNDTASKLIEKLCDKGIIYPYMQSLFQGLPTIRNNQSGHGHGMNPKVIYPSYAEFSLNLAGSSIVFLINRYHELK